LLSGRASISILEENFQIQYRSNKDATKGTRDQIGAVTNFKTSSEILSEFVALDFHDLANKEIAFENSVV